MPQLFYNHVVGNISVLRKKRQKAKFGLLFYSSEGAISSGLAVPEIQGGIQLKVKNPHFS